LTAVPGSLAEIPPSLSAAERSGPGERQARSVSADADPGVLIRPAAGRSLPPSAVAAVRRGVADGGAPLPEPIRRPAEHRTGMDFAAVRVHAGEHAAESARALGAQAYTVGRHIVFGAGHYEPASPAGARLLMHELAHVAQQSVTGRVQLARQEDPDAKLSLGALDSPVVAAVVTPVVGDTSWAVLREFLRGMWGGLLSAPPEQLDRIQKKADDFGVVEALKYVGGYALGIIEGLWTSVKGLLEAIWTLIKLPYTIIDFLITKLPALAEKYGPRIRQALTGADGLSERLANLLKGFLEHPRDSLKQLSGLLDAIGNLALEQVRALGRAASGKLLALLGEDWFDMGRDIGKVVGQILFEVILAVASDGIAAAAKSALRIAGELAARAVAETVELLRGIGRLFGQALEWVQGIGRRLAGEASELFEAIEALLSRLRAIFAEMVEEDVVAETGVRGVKVPVPEPKGASVLESRAVKPPRTSPATVADLRPPKVHPSNLPAGQSQPRFPPRAPGTPSRFTGEQIAQDLAATQRKVSSGEKALEETGVAARTLRRVDEYHHLFVQQLRKWFKARGIDIDRFTVRLSADEHRWIHNEYRWNDLWKEFRLKNPTASPQEIIEHLELLKKQVGLEGLDVVPYPH